MLVEVKSGESLSLGLGALATIAIVILATGACSGSEKSTPVALTATTMALTTRPTATAATTTVLGATAVSVPPTAAAGPFPPRSLAGLAALGSAAPDQAKHLRRDDVGL